jgi:hypothetical protein
MTGPPEVFRSIPHSGEKFLILLDFVVGLPLAQTVHEFSRINEWKDLHSGIRGLIRGWLTAKPQIPLEPEKFSWLERGKRNFQPWVRHGTATLSVAK